MVLGLLAKQGGEGRGEKGGVREEKGGKRKGDRDWKWECEERKEEVGAREEEEGSKEIVVVGRVEMEEKVGLEVLTIVREDRTGEEEAVEKVED